MMRSKESALFRIVLDDIIRLVSGRDKNDRDGRRAWVLLEFAADLKTVDVWHHHVQQDQIRHVGSGDPEGDFTSRGEQNLVSLGFEDFSQNLQVGRNVVHDQNARSGPFTKDFVPINLKTGFENR